MFRLRGAAPACGLGTKAHKSSNCPFDTFDFLSELCDYGANVHVYPFFNCDVCTSKAIAPFETAAEYQRLSEFVRDFFRARFCARARFTRFFSPGFR